MHVITNFDVPKYVKVALAKSSKFIPDKRATSFLDVSRSLCEFSRSLHLDVFFKDCPDCLPSRRLLPTRFLSKWQPPASPEVQSLHRQLLSIAYDYIERKPPRRPMIETEMFRWLRENPHVIVVDADKGLGDVLCDTDWVRRKLDERLDEAGSEVDHDVYLGSMAALSAKIKHIALQGLQNRVFTWRQSRELLVRTDTAAAGTARVSIKIHKDPPDTRPIFNLGMTMIAPAAQWLNDILLEIQRGCGFVLTDTSGALSLIRDLVLQPGETLYTIDVVNLYPSIPRRELLAFVSEDIRKHCKGNTARASCAIELLHVVLQGCIVQANGRLILLERGIPTGISCCVGLANVFLNRFDVVAARLPYIRSFGRFVDDTIVVATQNPLHDFHRNSFGLCWEITGSLQYGDTSKRISFLDLEL